MTSQIKFYEEKLEELKKESNFRYLKDFIQEGKFLILNNSKLLNLSSNDYLGISIDENIKDNFLSSYKGKLENPSARLLSGSNKPFYELENLIQEELNVEAALLFNSGYHANVGIYSALLNRDDVVFIDKLNHASIIDGIHLSGAKLIPFNHLDYDDLENKLKKYRNQYKNAIISTETLFSMDGDIADIKKLVELKNKFNSILIIDEAHSFGVYGKGKGICHSLNLTNEIDLIMGTFGKAVGSYGAFAAGKKVLINYLINFARSFIFSTALPEVMVSFSKFILENYIFSSDKLQNKLFDITNYTLSKFPDTPSKSYIIPVILGENERAVMVSNELIKNGFYVLPIRYPTVKKGSARIRISLNPFITKDEIDSFSKIISMYN